MEKEVNLGPMGQGTFKLISALEFHAKIALQEQKMHPEIKNDFENALNDLTPSLSRLASVLDKSDLSEHGFQALWRLISCAVTLVDPIANKEGITAAFTRESLSENGRVGGINSGIVRAAAAEEGWKKHALELAKTIRSEEPSTSQDNLATEIINRWKLENPKCVGHSMLKTTISEWERAEKLAKREPAKK